MTPEQRETIRKAAEACMLGGTVMQCHEASADYFKVCGPREVLLLLAEVESLSDSLRQQTFFENELKEQLDVYKRSGYKLMRIGNELKVIMTGDDNSWDWNNA